MERKVYFLGSKVFILWMISKRVTFDENRIEKKEFEGKLRFSFPFYIDDIHFKEAREEIRRAKDEHLRLEFPEETTENQLTWKEASDIYYDALRRKEW